MIDLDFKAHPSGQGGSQARIDFDNGYGASVITGNSWYTSEDTPYELAVMLDGRLCYTSGITEDVIGYQTADEVQALLERIKALPSDAGEMEA